MDAKGIRRFLKYTSVGGGTFLMDLALLWLLIDIFSAPILPATAGAFLLSVSVNFLISRVIVFKGSTRTIKRGYLFFMTYGITGAALTTGLMWYLTEATNLHYVLVRVLIAGFVGCMTYLANLYLNFKVAGKHMEA